MKIALVYDWLTTPYGGAERVLLALHQLYPQAPLYTSVYDSDQAKWAKDFNIKTSWLQKIPGAKKHHRWLALFLPLAFESFNFDEYDVIISMTSFSAKGIITKPHQLHICYLLTPTRFLYSHRQAYEQSWQSIPIFNWFIKHLLNYLRAWDQMAIHRPDAIIPISKLISQRVLEYYHLPTNQVIYPPVSLIASPTITNDKTDILPANSYFLIVSRLVSYKKIELAIQACQHLHQNLIIVGDGPEKNRLQSIINHSSSPAKILLLGSVSPNKLAKLYTNCQALIMCWEEDFGLTGLEALAYGKPVMIYQQSGVAELIIDHQHGIHIKELTVSGVEQAITQIKMLKFNRQQLINQAHKFSVDNFHQQFRQLIDHLQTE